MMSFRIESYQFHDKKTKKKKKKCDSLFILGEKLEFFFLSKLRISYSNEVNSMVKRMREREKGDYLFISRDKIVIMFILLK